MRVSYAISIFLAFIALPALAQDDKSKAMLDQLSVAPKASGQPDLDTTQLASAHRARARSVDERTNGLWQSWVVAICKGCGVQERQYAKKDADALVERAHAQMKAAPGTSPLTNTAKFVPRAIRPIDILDDQNSAVTTGAIGRSPGEGQQ